MLVDYALLDELLTTADVDEPLPLPAGPEFTDCPPAVFDELHAVRPIASAPAVAAAMTRTAGLGIVRDIATSGKGQQ